MARYIDADNFRKTMIKRFGCVPCLTDYSEASRYDIPIDDALNLAPAAEVAPKSEVEWLEKENARLLSLSEYNRSVIEQDITDAKSEVAREIFEEIAQIKKEYASGDIDGDTLYVMLHLLEKKYTEANHETRN